MTKPCFLAAAALTFCLTTQATASTYQFEFSGGPLNPGMVTGLIEGLDEDNLLGQSTGLTFGIATSAVVTSVSNPELSGLIGLNFVEGAIGNQFLFVEVR